MKTYRQIVQQLQQVYPESEARALARWLCEESLGLTRTDLLLDKDNHLSAYDIEITKEIVNRLLRHEPIQYVLGGVDFCGHRFAVAPGVLIPRPETEQLVAHVVHVIETAFQGKPDGASSFRVLDIGTGSGCIALSLALALPEIEVTAWDISEEALSIAQSNASSYPQARVTFECEDILNPTPSTCCWDVIVSNPPYVRRCEAKNMSANVLEYEPHLALFVPDEDPLLFYRAIARFATTHLSPGGQLWFEINQYLSKETAQLIRDMGFCDVMVMDDDYGHPRFLHAVKTP